MGCRSLVWAGEKGFQPLLHLAVFLYNPLRLQLAFFLHLRIPVGPGQDRDCTLCKALLRHYHVDKLTQQQQL